jgi:hypothetical protein
MHNLTAPQEDAVVRAALAQVMQAFFDAVSLERDVPRYDELRELFVTGAGLINNTADVLEVSAVDAFIASRRGMVQAGELTSFHETEQGAITDVLGTVAHRLSAYDKRGTRNGIRFRASGLVSTQFIRTPHGWKISSMAWEAEHPTPCVPDRPAGTGAARMCSPQTADPRGA